MASQVPGKPSRSDDLRRFAIVSNEGEIFDVGLRGHEASAYASSYNHAMADTGNSVRIVPCVIHVEGVEVPATRPAFVEVSSHG